MTEPAYIAQHLIRTDGSTQCRVELSTETIEDYAEAYSHGDDMPPIDVFFDGVHYWLADGFHRLSAFRKIRLKEINCVVHNGTVRDARLFAFSANPKHGKRRTTEDKRHAVAMLLTDSEWVNNSDRWIAERCNVSADLVSSVRSNGSAANATNPAPRKGRDGKTRNERLYCKRCLKGTPVTACIYCAADRKKAKEQQKAAALAAQPQVEPGEDAQEDVKPRKKRKTSGSVMFDWKAFYRSYGELVRSIDTFGVNYQVNETPAAEGVRRKLDELLIDFKKWTTEVTKATPPE